jgi:hypothetical protein
MEPLIDLASLVDSEDGQGFLVGHTPGGDPNYTVMLFDRRLVMPRNVRLLDAAPLDHPKLPPGMRPCIERRITPGTKKSLLTATG